MKIQNLAIGQRVRHPRYGVGTVKSISEQTAEVRFDDATRTIDPVVGELVPAEPAVAVSGLEMPLSQFVESAIDTLLTRIGYEDPGAVVRDLGARWHSGRLVLHPADPALQTKEVPIEIFFHKLVGVRNQLLSSALPAGVTV